MPRPMRENELPVTGSVTRADGTVEQVQVGTAVRHGDGFSVRLGEVSVGGAGGARFWRGGGRGRAEARRGRRRAPVGRPAGGLPAVRPEPGTVHPRSERAGPRVLRDGCPPDPRRPREGPVPRQGAGAARGHRGRAGTAGWGRAAGRRGADGQRRAVLTLDAAPGAPVLDLAPFSRLDGWISLLTLTALEVVLGIDNLVFLSIMTGKLPPERQPLARRLGLGLALVMRVLLLLAMSWLVTLETNLF